MRAAARADSACQHNPMPAEDALQEGSPMSYALVLRYGEPTKELMYSDYSEWSAPTNGSLFLENGVSYRPNVVSTYAVQYKGLISPLVLQCIALYSLVL